MSKEQIIEFIMENEFVLNKRDLKCGELLKIKDNFYKEYGKKPRISEAIIFKWLQFYLSQAYGNKYILKSETKYPAQIGNQTLDITLLERNEIKLGISIKMSSSTSAYLDGADFENSFFDKYRKHFIKDEDEYERKIKEGKRIGVPTLLQDMARIQNIKALRTYFPSITIVYSSRKPKDTFWINEFENFGHQYIFLEEHLNASLLEVLIEKVPSLSR